MPKFLASVLVGLISGVLSGAAGLGGAVLSTPGVRALGAPPLVAVGTTVPPIFLAAAVGSVNYIRSRNCDLRVAGLTGATGLLFTVLGAYLTRPIGGRILMLATAFLVIYGGSRILRGKGGPIEGPDAEPSGDSSGQGFAYSDPSGGSLLRALTAAEKAKAAGIGVIAGLLSGLLGIGGGIVMLPAYFTILKMPVKRTTGTSLFVAGLMAVPGTLAHSYLGNIDWNIAAGLGAGALVGSYVGSRITISSREGRVRLYVGLILVTIGVVYLIGEIASLLRAGSWR
jgi:uncharacterized membrane protein YfcA